MRARLRLVEARAYFQIEARVPYSHAQDASNPIAQNNTTIARESSLASLRVSDADFVKIFKIKFMCCQPIIK